MLENAISGARENGAEVELFNLYKMQFSGFISCVSCKRLDRERPIVCAVKDELKPVLEKVCEIDGILIAAPVYYGLNPLQPAPLSSACVSRISIMRTTPTATFHGEFSWVSFIS
jgi:hypothetical protein